MSQAPESLNEALQYHQSGDLQKAERAYLQLLKHADGETSGKVLFLLASLYLQLSKLESAQDYLNQLIELAGETPVSRKLQAQLHQLKNQPGKACEIYESLLTTEEDDEEVLFGLGLIYQQDDRFADAEEMYQRVVKINNGRFDAWNNLGEVQQDQAKLVEAENSYTRAIELNPGFEQIHNNLGTLLQETGQYREALDAYQQALSINPDYPEAHYNIALTCLLQGDYQNGWDEYRWRWKLPKNLNPVSSIPEWQGEELSGKTILVYAEQGFGDTFQFIRYLKTLRGLGATVVFETLPGLEKISSWCDAVDQLLVRGQYNTATLAVDFSCPLLNLPYYLGTTVATIPAETPYLVADQQKDSCLQGRELASFKTGIVWGGKTQHGSDYYRNPSCPLQYFEPISDIKDVSLVCLQKGEALNQLANVSFANRVLVLDDCLSDFTDTARVILDLDLVITIDTAVAHLAGALGKPVWLLLPVAPDWRWMLDRSDSPWYPSIRIFRQDAPGDWKGLLNRVADELKNTVQTSGSRQEPSLDQYEVEHYLQKAAQLVREQKYPEAENMYSRILQSAPGHFDALNNIAIAQKNQGKLAEAASNVQKAISVRPDSSAAHNNLGNIKKQQGNLLEARQHYLKAVELQPENAEALNNLGNTLQALGAGENAITLFRAAIESKPDFAQAHFNYAIASLLAGDYETGWKEYEWGFHTGQREKVAATIPEWNGEDLKGKTVLVLAEQGFGDTFQFLRFLPLLQERGAHVVLRCKEELQALLKYFPGCNELLLTGQEPARNPDFLVSMMSLPNRLHITLDNLPADIPYLFPEPSILGRWQERLLPIQDFKVGLVWAGNPSHENDQNRSCSLDDLSSLFSFKGIQFFSLQKGEAARQAESFSRIESLGAELTDYAQTAAVISCLDLVITVDTSVAHLAGALGKPVWVMLPFAPDWRWLEKRSDSPWYPTARLFRQSEDRSWLPVVERISEELARKTGQEIQYSQESELNALLDKANRLATARDFSEAILLYKKILTARPGYPEVLNNLANVYLETGELEQAKVYYQKALKERPDYSQSLNGLGTALQQLGEYDRALDCFNHAIKLQPDFVLAHYNRSLLWLLQGRLDEGFREYEWRLGLPGRQVSSFGLKQWGGESLEGKNILVVPEQGAGDTIQFLRFIPVLKQQGARVMLVAMSGQEEIMQQVNGVDEVVQADNPGIADADFYAPLMSLPSVLGAGNVVIRQEKAYLQPVPERANQFAHLLEGLKGLKVGLVWAGNPTHPNDRNRSCRVSDFRPLVDMHGVSFISLQVGTFAEQVSQLPGVLNMSPHLEDYSDTAALISCMDLVVCVDTSVAHLAGALNIPVWILLPYVPDWRWQQAGDTTDWYSSAKLYRQDMAGDWAGVIERVTADLKELATKEQKSTLSPMRDTLLQQGLNAHRQGSLEEAEKFYRQLLDASPDDSEGMFLLSSLLYQKNGLNEAAKILDDLLSQGGGNAKVLNLYGLVQQERELYADAEKSFKLAVENEPGFSDAQFNLGYLWQIQDQPEKAGEVYEQLLAQGIYQERIFYNLALVYQELKRIEKSIETYRKTLEINPGNAQAWNNLGSLLQHKGDLDEAIDCYGHSVELMPGNTEAHINLGYAYLKKEDFTRARQEYEAALAIQADSIQALLNLAALLQIQEEFEQSIEVYERVLSLEPEQAVALNNLGSICLKQAQIDQALDYYQRSIRSAPDYADAHFNLGILKLLKGDFQHGWKEYDWRLKREYSGVRTVTGDTWDGSDLQGRKILVFSEQGFGDTFQFVRFLPLVKEKHGHVLFECQNGLRTVLKDCAGADQVIDWSEDGDLEISYDVSIPLMSIPSVLNIEEKEIEATNAPYISPGVEKVNDWAESFDPNKLNIGLVWAGRPTHHNDKNRSCRLDDFNPLFQWAGDHVCFYSLQKGEATRQLQASAYSKKIVNLDERLTSFAETAAVLSHLDLLISVDTSVVHLAGAMGKEVWVLLPHVPDWRWLLERDTSPWYPNTRLFRQEGPGEWEKLFAHLLESLEGFRKTED